METKPLPACPVETTLSLISDKWKVLIIRDLLPGTKRFGELKKSIGNVSQKVLTSQLRQMEESGLLIRTVFPEVPPRVEYTLTELGQSLKPVLDAMWNWGEEYKAHVFCRKPRQQRPRNGFGPQRIRLRFPCPEPPCGERPGLHPQLHSRLPAFPASLRPDIF